MSVLEVAPRIFMVTPGQEPGSAWQSPNIFLIGPPPFTMIDSGYDREHSLSAITDALGDSTLERVLLTHVHLDHAGGAWTIREKTGSRVFGHPAEEPALARRFPGKKLDGMIEAGDRIEAGPYTLSALLMPGHARGHLLFWIEERGILFSGDLITGEGSTLVVPPEGNMKQYMDSLRRIAGLPVKLLLPGHGPIVSDAKKRIAGLIEHRELREICILHCLEEGPLKLVELVQAMYLGMIHPHLVGAAAGTAWAHLEKLIEEGVVRSEPENQANPFNLTFSLAPGLRLPF